MWLSPRRSEFFGYLEPGNYWGINNSATLLEAGWSVELPPLSFQRKQPRAQLVCLADFEFMSLAHIFDYVLAHRSLPVSISTKFGFV